MPNTKLEVHLSAEQRAELEVICSKHSVAAAKLRRARVLLMSDEDHLEGRRHDWEIAEALGMSARQVVRIRQRFVREGEITLERRVWHGRCFNGVPLASPVFGTERLSKTSLAAPVAHDSVGSLHMSTLVDSPFATSFNWWIDGRC